MSSTKHRLGVLGVVIAAIFSLTALNAGTAQAFEWHIEKQSLSSLGGLEEIVANVGLTIFRNASGIQMHCLRGVFKASVDPGGVFLDAKTEYFECTFLGAPHCQISEPLTLKSTGKVISHNAKSYALFQGGEKGLGTFTVTDLGGCTLFENEEEVVIAGSFALFLPEASVELATHEMRTLTEAEETLLASALKGFGLFMGAEVLQLVEGNTMKVKLGGSHAGQKWNVS